MVKAALANSAWWLASSASWSAFASALADPRRAQEEVLRRIIRNNSRTAFGREYGLDEISTPEQFARRLPVLNYDEMQPWIDRIRQGEQRVLTVEPVRHLVPTSGSSAARKLVPYTASMHRELNRAIGPWIFDLYLRHPRALLGPSYWSISPLTQERSDIAEDSAVPVGFDDDAAYLGAWRKVIVDAVMAVPAALGDIALIENWQYATALMLLRRRSLSLISVWHPSFLELLLGAMRRHWHCLVRDVADGTCAVMSLLPSSVVALMNARPDPRRADELRQSGPSAFDEVWPGLKVVSCWADGHAAPAAAELARSLPSVTVQPKGLLATEGIISIPFAGQHPLAIRSHFLEFEDDSGRVSMASDLQSGRAYNVILTNAGGLCRYRLNDRVEVAGMVGRTPSIRFVGRSGLVSDRMGEKMSEGFVAGVLWRLFEDSYRRPTFAMMAPDIDGDGCRYTLYFNAEGWNGFGTALDTLLSANPQYAYCRRLGQLRTPRLFRVSGHPYFAYCDRLRRAGQRLGDIKPVALSCLDNWSAHLPGGYI